MPSSASSPPLLPSLSLHDALPICRRIAHGIGAADIARDTLQHIGNLAGIARKVCFATGCLCELLETFRVGVSLERIDQANGIHDNRSEEHTSELQSHHDLVCRLPLPPLPYCPLFPYTTLFRSAGA